MLIIILIDITKTSTVIIIYVITVMFLYENLLTYLVFSNKRIVRLIKLYI